MPVIFGLLMAGFVLYVFFDLTAPLSNHSCDVDRVQIGMNRDRVLGICGRPTRTWRQAEDHYKFGRDTVRNPGTDWMVWGDDVVTLRDGRVDYTDRRSLP